MTKQKQEVDAAEVFTDTQAKVFSLKVTALIQDTHRGVQQSCVLASPKVGVLKD